MNRRVNISLLLCFLCTVFFSGKSLAKELSETSFIILSVKHSNTYNDDFWDFIQSDNNTGLELKTIENGGQVFIAGTDQTINHFIERLHFLINNDSTKIIPVFIDHIGDISLLETLIGNSSVSSRIFHLPHGETWPPVEYLLQANRRIIIFLTGNHKNTGNLLHRSDDYIFSISAASSGSMNNTNRTNLELFSIYDFEKLPTNTRVGSNIRDLVPDYIQFLLENWSKYGKKPNFIFVDDISSFDFIIRQLNSFTWINGIVKSAGKALEKVYWRNPEVSVTGNRFNFPYRGGEELTLTPFVPGFVLTPAQIIVTGEMEVPENYSIAANPLSLGDGLTGSFRFDDTIQNTLEPERIFPGENYSFSQDIERGTVLKLPENSSINLGHPDAYGFRNNSFSVSCFVKFSEIMEFGDNAILGNYESEYRRGLHLILRSGHPYFGLWSNDYVSEVKLEPNVWYHLVWRYIIDNGEQAIFLDGRNIGSSVGHPPFSGTGDIHLGSAISQGASLRGYIDDMYFWDRPLGSDEINRLVLDEIIAIEKAETGRSFIQSNKTILGTAILVFIFSLSVFFLIFRKKIKNRIENLPVLPEKNAANQINLFGGFRAVDKDGIDISAHFTPKVKELFLYTLFSTMKNPVGATVSDIDEQLWNNLPAKKVTNNRAVTLNKLRKILHRIDGLEIVSQNGFLRVELMEPLFCDYVEVYNLCQVPGGMDKQQLELFFLLVKKGLFLKGLNWPWLDEMRGFTGTQVIDNLLKLVSWHKSQQNLPKIETLVKRILEYDDLNEEAIWLQVWIFRQNKNNHQAKFYFDSFCVKYNESMGEPYPMNIDEFNNHFSVLL